MAAARAGAEWASISDKAQMDFRYAVRVGGCFRLIKQALALLVGDKHGIQQAFLPIRGFLRQQTHAGIARHADGSILRLQGAREQMQQG